MQTQPKRTCHELGVCQGLSGCVLMAAAPKPAPKPAAKPSRPPAPAPVNVVPPSRISRMNGPAVDVAFIAPRFSSLHSPIPTPARAGADDHTRCPSRGLHC